MHWTLLICLNAFLLFAIQPLLGKSLLPLWGGSAQVWATCLTFFQSALLLGVLYAHRLGQIENLRLQKTIHCISWGVCLALLGFLQFQPREWWSDSPVASIFLDLSLRIGLPLLLLSSTSSLASVWYYQSTQSQHPFHWYALSNLSSLAACLAYPFLIEPNLGLETQKILWMLGFTAVALLWFHQAYRMQKAPPADDLRTNLPTEPTNSTSSHPWHAIIWVSLSACSSMVLSAATSSASQAGVIVPGIWSIPLAIYLATWWAAFTLPSLSKWGIQWLAACAGMCTALILLVFKLWVPWWGLIAGYLLVVGSISIACHGLIYALRPAPKDISKYYLWISFGGVLGSSLVSLVAPWALNDQWELHIALALGALTAGGYYAIETFPRIATDNKIRRFLWPVTVTSTLLCLIVLTAIVAAPSREEVVAKKRDFYGVVSVIENPDEGILAMLHGQIRHGTEPLSGPLHPDSTTYYKTNSGVALAWGWCHDHFKKPLNVGIVGLGAGSLSLYAHQPDTITYYEVSPAVVELAQSQFRYLKSHTGKTEIKLGDGRFLLQKEAALTNTAKLQLLVLDAFSNDALPTHLLTKQAFELYGQRLAPDGLLAFNITNRNLNLAPTLFATSKQLGLKPLLVENDSVRWLVLFPESIPLPNWPGGRDRLSESQTISSQHGWTDDFASPIQAMRW